MAKKAMRWFWGTLAVLTGIGGAVHALQGGLNISLLSAFGSWARLVQTVAGVSTVVVVVKYFTMRR